MTRISNKLGKEYNYIIVGQGIAGTCLASELLERGKRVLVFDDPKLPSSSTVAGGLFNPITGRNMVLTWKVQELFPYLAKFYGRLGEKLGVKLVHDLPIYRPFASMQELNEWQGKSSDERFKPYIDFVSSKPIAEALVKNELGGIMLKQTGYIDVKLMLAGFRELLREKEIIREEQFLYENLNFTGNSCVYKEYSAEKIIFCDGSDGFGNRLLEKIRFHRVKGEVLRLQIDYESGFILNRNGFVMPRGDGYLAGSNYCLTDSTWEPTAEGKDEIVNKIDKILHIDYKIVGHVAGIRPTSHDRRPVLGMLPDNPQVGVFNGLGTKGVSLAPYFASQFAENLINKTEIEQEVQIGRYFN